MTKEEAEQFLANHECTCGDSESWDYPCLMSSMGPDEWAKWDEAYEIAYGRKA
jgi:hypothetical protein